MMHYEIPYNLKSVLELCRDKMHEMFENDTSRCFFLRDEDDATITYFAIIDYDDCKMNILYKFKDNFLIEIVDSLYQEIPE
jgi:hypothetical protein